MTRRVPKHIEKAYVCQTQTIELERLSLRPDATEQAIGDATVGLVRSFIALAKACASDPAGAVEEWDFTVKWIRDSGWDLPWFVAFRAAREAGFLDAWVAFAKIQLPDAE